MNTDPTSTDVFAILAVAQANWPHDPVAGSEAVWRKWGEPLRRYRFEEVAAALDSLARTHQRVPSLAELLEELGARRRASKAHIQSIVLPPDRDLCAWPPVPLGPDYVIGPYSLAFAKTNPEGWTPQRLVACIRHALQSPIGAAGPGPSVADGPDAAPAADVTLDPD